MSPLCCILARMRVLRADAGTELTALLDHVERGESVVITRHGRPIARIVPESENELYDAREVIDSIRALRKTMPRLTLEDITSARHEGHMR